MTVSPGRPRAALYPSGAVAETRVLADRIVMLPPLNDGDHRLMAVPKPLQVEATSRNWPLKLSSSLAMARPDQCAVSMPLVSTHRRMARRHELWPSSER